MRVRFNLKDKKLPKTYIIMSFRYDGQWLRWYPTELIQPKDWSVQDGRVKRGVRGAIIINEGLDKIEAFVLDTYRTYRNAHKELTPKAFAVLLDEFWKGRTVVKAPETEIPILRAWILQVAADKMAQGYILPVRAHTYKTVANKMEILDKERKRPTRFEDVDLDWLSDFLILLKRSAASPNTLRKYVLLIKTVMGEALERGLTNNRAWQSKRFSYDSYKSDQIALSEREVAALAELDLSNNPTYDVVRDLFLLGCYTGLRYSDYSTLSAANLQDIEGVKILVKRARKTQKQMAIAIVGDALRIINKYNGNIPKGVNNRNMNVYLRKIAQMAGITTIIEVERYDNGLLVRKKTPKYMEVRTHTARRTFATIEYLRAVREGRPIEPIIAVTGHATLAQFLSYVKASAEMQAIAFVKSKAK